MYSAQTTNAMNKANSMLSTDTYNVFTNSCVSYAKDVMKAGGLKPKPTILALKGLENYIKRLK